MLRVGDLIIFNENSRESPSFGKLAGLVVQRDRDEYDDGILVQFSNEAAVPGPLHYYDRELVEWLKRGTIEIQHAS